MKRDGWVIWIGALLVVVPSSWSADRAHPGTVAATPITPASEGLIESDSPDTHQRIVQISFGPAVAKSRPVKEKLTTAYHLAVDRLREVSECRALFASLEADGVEALTRSVYARANAGMEATWCRHAVAGTTVGKKMVFLCRRFSGLPVEEAATILIHEAMHRAGMSEAPLDANALTGDEISSIVRRSCFLFDDVRDIRVVSKDTESVEPRTPTRTPERGSVAVRVASNLATPIGRPPQRFTGALDMRTWLPY